MKTRALIFDFDGLILDTETSEFRIWQAIYREYGQEMLPETWGQVIGGYGTSDFDGAVYLAGLLGNGVKAEELSARYRSESDALIAQQPILPGVMDYLDEAQRLGLGLAVASSSPHSWVDAHLTRLGLFDRFQHIICADEVSKSRTKPHPDLYLKALGALGIQADEAIAFEDSPNGILAAKRAGIFVVLIPNPVTALLKADSADLHLNSLTELPLQVLLDSR